MAMAATASNARSGANSHSNHYEDQERAYNGQEVKFDSSGVENIAMCASPGPVVPSKTKKSRKSNTPVARISRWVVEHQIGISLAFLTGLFAVQKLVPSSYEEIQKFYTLNYYNPNSKMYAAGWDDGYFIFFWIMAFFGLRVGFMDYMAAPFAAWINVKGKKDQTRFAEQAWIVFYYVISFYIGMHLQYNSNYWLNLDNMWTNWPQREITGLMKWYYLVQLAFWLQQIVVVNIEERRKDHWQMFTHHIVTCLLMSGSYAYHHTRVGNVVLCLMDGVDIALAFAKVLRYMGLQFACDCCFGVFLVSWIICRHVLYMIVCWSVYSRIPVASNMGCYYGTSENLVGPFDVPESPQYLLGPFIDPQGLVCMTDAMRLSFLGLLLFLQMILLFWLSEILTLAWKVIMGGESADDPRSDDEGESEEVEIDKIALKSQDDGNAPSYGQMVEEEVGVEQINFKSRPIVHSKSGGRTSGVQFPVKKELLNRVGCDTKTTN